MAIFKNKITPYTEMVLISLTLSRCQPIEMFTINRVSSP